MNCKQAQALFLDYLDQTLALQDRNALQAHLEECPRCAKDLEDLIETQSLIRISLRTRTAAQFVSSQAWDVLQSKINAPLSLLSAKTAKEPRRWFSGNGFSSFTQNERRTSMKGKLIFSMLATVILVVAAIFFVPNVWARMGNLLQWFKFEGPGRGVEVLIPGIVEFTPLRPSYLPDGFKAMAVGLSPETASLNYWNESTNQFLSIDENLVTGEKASLPQGTQLTVAGRPAVLIEGLAREITFVQLPPTPEPSALPQTPAVEEQPLEPLSVSENVQTVSYTDGKQLVWDIDNVRIQITSNLPLAEMLRIAESLVPAESEETPPTPIP